MDLTEGYVVTKRNSKENWTVSNQRQSCKLGLGIFQMDAFFLFTELKLILFDTNAERESAILRFMFEVF